MDRGFAGPRSVVAVVLLAVGLACAPAEPVRKDGPPRNDPPAASSQAVGRPTPPPKPSPTPTPAARRPGTPSPAPRAEKPAARDDERERRGGGALEREREREHGEGPEPFDKPGEAQ